MSQELHNPRRFHHHYVVPLAQISLTLSCHLFLSFITSSRSSGLHPVSSHSCCMLVRAGRQAFARPCVGVHRSTSLMSSSRDPQQCPAYLVRLTKKKKKKKKTKKHGIHGKQHGGHKGKRINSLTAQCNDPWRMNPMVLRTGSISSIGELLLLINKGGFYI